VLPSSAERIPTLNHRDIKRVQVGPRTGFPHDRSPCQFVDMSAEEHGTIR
jgi:hypothetical protein